MRRARRTDWTDEVLAILGEMRPGGQARVRGEARLQADLGLDSLALVAVALRLHEELGVDPAELTRRAGAISTVDDLFAAVAELRAASPSREAAG